LGFLEVGEATTARKNLVAVVVAEERKEFLKPSPHQLNFLRENI